MTSLRLGRANRLGHFLFGWFDQHVFKSRSGWDHGEDIVGLVTFGVDEAGPLIVVESLLQGAPHISGSLDVEALDAVGGGQFDKIGIALQVDTALAVVKEEFLPLPDHSEVVVVENENLEWQLV